LDSDLSVMTSQRNFTSNVQTGLAGISKGSTYNEGFKKNIMSLSYLAVYNFFGQKRETQSTFFAANPDVETSAMIWNLLDDYKVKALFDRFLTHNETKMLVHVPKLDTKITLQNMGDLPDLGNWKDYNT